jgi:hypothetical protein
MNIKEKPADAAANEEKSQRKPAFLSIQEVFKI